ncbi:MAG: response regulator transcription factor [Anaerolineales bacterium]|nr:response regulator transcription factor [Anaerolineales bacterium]
MTKPIILLAEDHPGWDKLLRHSLNNNPNLIVQDSFGSKQEVLAAIADFPLDLLVLDVKLRDGCALALYEYLQQMETPISSLVLTAHDEDVYMAWALAGGAVGHLLKTEDVESIVDAIRRAAWGEWLWTEYQLLRIRHWQQVAGDKWATLTEREREVVAALADFKCDVEIAEVLGISVKTAGNHVTHILEKLDMPNRREVARWAVRYKLVGFGYNGPTFTKNREKSLMTGR